MFIYRIAGIFRGGKFSPKPLQLYYSNYSRAEFSRNAPSSAKNYPFCTELTVGLPFVITRWPDIYSRVNFSRTLVDRENREN